MPKKKISLKQTAYECVKEKILSCCYRPGTFLNEQQLCKETGGLSRTPMRDALGRLEQEGLVNILPKKGVMVSELRISDINRIYEVRTLLEPYVLRRYGKNLDKTEMEKFRAELEAATETDATEHYRLDDRFHQLIMKALPNRYLMDTYENIRNLNRRFRVLSGDQVKNRVDATVQEHLDILNACLAGEWEHAAESMTAHLEKSRQAAFMLMIDSTDQQL